MLDIKTISKIKKMHFDQFYSVKYICLWLPKSRIFQVDFLVINRLFVLCRLCLHIKAPIPTINSRFIALFG